MKTTIDLPDDLMRTVKVRAASENRKLKDVVADLLRRGLSDEPGDQYDVDRRVQLPLVECAHPAGPGEELTPQRLAQLMAEDDLQDLRQ